MPKKRTGEILLEKKLITAQQLESALSYHRRTGHRIGASLVATGALTESALAVTLAETLGLASVDLAKATPQWDALRLLQVSFCETRELFPLELQEGRGRAMLKVAMADPLNVPAMEEIEFTTGVKVVPVVAPLSAISRAIRLHYRKQSEEPPVSAEDEAAGKMVLVRPGGGEETVTTSTEMPAVKLPSPSEDDVPIIEGKEVPPGATAEVTERTALAELIRDRAEQRRRKKGGKSVEDDLSYLYGVKTSDESEDLDRLEHKFWVLLRLLAKKGIVTKDEFVTELDQE